MVGLVSDNRRRKMIKKTRNHKLLKMPLEHQLNKTVELEVVAYSEQKQEAETYLVSELNNQRRKRRVVIPRTRRCHGKQTIPVQLALVKILHKF